MTRKTAPMGSQQNLASQHSGRPARVPDAIIVLVLILAIAWPNGFAQRGEQASDNAMAPAGKAAYPTRPANSIGHIGQKSQSYALTSSTQHNPKPPLSGIQPLFHQPLTSISNEYLFGELTIEIGETVDLTAVGDFNRDGKVDLVVYHEINGIKTLSIFFGQPDGTYGSRADYPVNGNLYGMVVGDFNHDGILDLAFDNLVLLGNGDGTFGNQKFYTLPQGSNPAGLVVADFNHDGKLDLADR